MNHKQLSELIRSRRTYLCVGLDPAWDRMPQSVKEGRSVEDALFDFNRAIIDATKDYCVAYKPNTAFYECHGVEGMKALKRTIDYIRGLEEPMFIIADAKRGDIGNTSKMYAKAFFGHYQADAVTVAPYMGRDSVEPFLGFEGKWAIVLGLTSNAGSADFQQLRLAENGNALYEQVLRTVSSWGSKDEIMFVVGATKAEMFDRIREIVPENFLLVPGVGAQGGSLSEVSRRGMTADCGLLVNSSRGIIHASSEDDFAIKARESAAKLASEMSAILHEKGI